MTLRIPNEGESQMLGIALGKVAFSALTLKLYSNDKVPAETDTTASFTEVSGNGYAAIALTGANWTLTEGAPTNAVYPEQIFTFTGAAGNVYGYYVVDAAGKVRWAERFTTSPFVVTAAGDKVKITLNVTLQDLLD